MMPSTYPFSEPQPPEERAHVVESDIRIRATFQNLLSKLSVSIHASASKIRSVCPESTQNVDKFQVCVLSKIPNQHRETR